MPCRDVAPAVALAPVDERLHLDDAAAGVEHELGSAGARIRLIAADAGQPAVGVPVACSSGATLRSPQQRSGRAARALAVRCACSSTLCTGAASRPRGRSAPPGARASRASRRTASRCRSRRGASAGRPRASCARGSRCPLPRAREHERPPKRSAANSHSSSARSGSKRSASRATSSDVRSPERCAVGTPLTLAIRLAYINKKASSCEAEPRERVRRQRHRARSPSSGPPASPCQSEPPVGTRSAARTTAA